MEKLCTIIKLATYRLGQIYPYRRRVGLLLVTGVSPHTFASPSDASHGVINRPLPSPTVDTTVPHDWKTGKGKKGKTTENGKRKMWKKGGPQATSKSNPKIFSIKIKDGWARFVAKISSIYGSRKVGRGRGRQRDDSYPRGFFKKYIYFPAHFCHAL